MKKLLPLLILLCCLSALAQTNVVKKTLLLSTNYSITFLPKDKGILIEIPDYKSKYEQHRLFSFDVSQAWQIASLLDKYRSFSIPFEENNLKYFSKPLGSIPHPSEDLKWGIDLDATIYISEEDKGLLILETKSGFLKVDSNVLVLDWSEVGDILELIKMIPDMQKEAVGTTK